MPNENWELPEREPFLGGDHKSFYNSILSLIKKWSSEPEWLPVENLNVNLSELVGTHGFECAVLGDELRLRGTMLAGSELPNETVLFKLPAAARPKKVKNVTIGYFSGTGATSQLSIGPTGNVSVKAAAIPSGKTPTLDGLSVSLS